MNAGTPARAGKPADRQILGLDCIRFLAALLVVFHHFGWRIWFENPALDMSYHFLEPFARPGFIGVEIFFVLSGFVIAYSASQATARSFLIGRANRLYPAAWICATLSLLLIWCVGHMGGALYPPNLLLDWMRSMVLWPKGPWIDGVYWTLAIEIGFYLQVALLLAAGLRRYLAAWMTVLGWLSTACLACLAWVVVHGTVVPSTGSSAMQWIAVHVWDRPPFLFLLLHHGCVFAVGVLLWLILLRRCTAQRILALLSMLPGVYLDIRLRVLWTGNWQVPLLVWTVAVLAIIASVRYNAELQEAVGERGRSVARRLGLMTYPLYLIHAAAGYSIFVALKPWLPDAVSLAAVTASMVLLSYAINVYLEVPLQRRVRRWLPLVPVAGVAELPASSEP